MEPAPSDTNGLLGIVYLNPNTGKACNDYIEENSNTNVWDNKCMKWYVYKDNGSTYDMILDHNAISNVQYNSDNDYTKPKEIEISLNTLKNKWQVLPRLITAQEVADVANLNSWAIDSYNTCLDDGTYCGSSSTHENVGLYWLFDNTTDCFPAGCRREVEPTNYMNQLETDKNLSVLGYWTSTSSEVWHSVYCVAWRGYIDRGIGADMVTYGLRPVITISK